MAEEKKPLERQPKPAKRKVRGNRSPGPKGRITKRTGDERSKPDKVKSHPWDPSRPLPNKVARHLKALGHHLDPVVQVGREGITEAIVKATKEQLHAHELIKVRISADAPVDRKDAGVELAEKAGASLAQTLGRTVLLYKRHPHKPKINLPR
jgi:RNA-binding protein